ncbi:MAG: autotransporter outer membrane beta-barrel domain-containing protein, partial [Paramuribaculum sp.]|nr:autotransporter outer membrane beta-barrel domain-containing protein [Paramuribaculum sp.]
MKPTRHNISLLLAAAAALVTTYQAAAQIDTEVKIRYEETPRLTELNKLRLTPVLSLPKTEQASLPFSSTNPSVTLPGNIATLDPAGYADTIYASPYRGYASIGFMPRFNLGASAGYNILNTDHTRLNAYFQYDGTSYRPDEMPKAIKQNTFTLGANVHQAVGKHSFIDAALDYTYSNYNTPLFDFERQSVNRFNASALWTYSTDNSVFGLGASYRRFSYGEAFYKPNY